MPVINISWGVNIDGGTTISGLSDAPDAPDVEIKDVTVAASQTDQAIPVTIDVSRLMFLIVVQTGAATTTTIRDDTGSPNFTWTLKDGVPAGVWTSNVDSDLKPVGTDVANLYVTTGADPARIRIIVGMAATG